jgi:WXXGXW repeat (2 copies)
MNSTARAWLMTLCIVGGVAAAPGLAAAGVGVVGIDINIAPPAPRVEVVPPPRVGYVWAPGYWEYRDRGHVWIPRRWVGERRGYR